MDSRKKDEDKQGLREGLDKIADNLDLKKGASKAEIRRMQQLAKMKAATGEVSKQSNDARELNETGMDMFTAALKGKLTIDDAAKKTDEKPATPVSPASTSTKPILKAGSSTSTGSKKAVSFAETGGVFATKPAAKEVTAQQLIGGEKVPRGPGKSGNSQ